MGRKSKELGMKDHLIDMYLKRISVLEAQVQELIRLLQTRGTPPSAAVAYPDARVLVNVSPKSNTRTKITILPVGNQRMLSSIC